MICGKCGAENAKDAKFCERCGQPLEGITEKSSQETLSLNADKKKTAPKNIIIVTVVGVLAIIALICFVANSTPTINLDKYVTIEAVGYDHYGSVDAIIDWDAIEEKYGDKISFNPQASEEYGRFLDIISPIDIMKDCIDIEFTETTYLSNGDKLEYVWEIDEELTEYIKCKFKMKGGTYTVADLEAVGSFDPFADMKITFDGIAPNGTVSYEYTGKQLAWNDFSCDVSNGLSNGDSVTISLFNKDMGYYAQRYGMTPDKVEQQYVVSGLDEYVNSYSKMTDEFVSALKSEAEDTIYAYVAGNYASASSLTDLQYSGYIFNVAKSADYYYQSYNNVYIIYSGTVSNSEGKFHTSTVFYPVKFTNILSGADGLSYDKNAGIEGRSDFGSSFYSTYGYLNPLTCYMEIVESNAGSYFAETGDGFDKYAKYELISSLDDMGGYRDALYADALQRVESYIAAEYDEESQVTDLMTLGECLLLAKTPGTNLESNNRYVVICSATVSHSQGEFSTTTVYFPIEYDGLVKLPENEYMYISTRGILGQSSLPNSWFYSTRGYVSGTEMYSKIVTANRDNYKYEVSDSLKEFE